MKRAHLTLLALLAIGSGHASAQDPAATLADCESKLVQAQKLDMLSRVSNDGGVTTIYVGRTWYSVGFDAKEGFARAVSCAIVRGKPGVCANFTFADGRSGKALARYKNCRLEPT